MRLPECLAAKVGLTRLEGPPSHVQTACSRVPVACGMLLGGRWLLIKCWVTDIKCCPQSGVLHPCDVTDPCASSRHPKPKLPSITQPCLLPPEGGGLTTPPLDSHQFQGFILRKIFSMTQCTIKVFLTAEPGCCQMDFHKTKELSAYQIIHMFCLFVFIFN